MIDYAGMVCLGDISYNLNDDLGKHGDEYFEEAEPYQQSWVQLVRRRVRSIIMLIF